MHEKTWSGGLGVLYRARWCLALAALLSAGCGKTAEEYLRAARSATSAAEQEELLTRAVEKAPTFRRARLLRALVYTQRGKYDPALADFVYLYRTAVSDREKAAILYERGQTLELAHQFRPAVDSYTEALALDPLFVNPYARRGRTFFKMGKYAQAIQDFSTMLKRDVMRNVKLGLGWQAELRYLRGYAAFCAGEWATASADFQHAATNAATASRQARSRLNRYFVECRLGNQKDAFRQLETYALRTLRQFSRPGKRADWIFFAVWYAAGRVDEKTFLERSQHKDPDTQAMWMAGARYYIGACCRANGDKDGALAAFKLCAQRRSPASYEYHMASVEMKRLLAGGQTADDYASLARNAENDAKRIEYYTQALRINPNHADSRLNRALIYSLTGKHDMAIADYTALLELYKEPRDIGMALRYRAWTHAQMRNHVAAVKDYQAAVQRDPKSWEARSGLAASLCTLRRYKEAVETYSDLIALTLDPRARGPWYLNRAFAQACTHDWRRAETDFRSALAGHLRTGDEPVARANLFVAQCKLGEKPAAAKALGTYAEGIKVAAWESLVVWHLADMLSIAKFTEASKHSKPEKQAWRLSRAHYYIGMKHLIQGKKIKAYDALKRCVELGRLLRRESWEYRMARAQLAKKDLWR